MSVKRKAAVFGFTLFIADILCMLTNAGVVLFLFVLSSLCSLAALFFSKKVSATALIMAAAFTASAVTFTAATRLYYKPSEQLCSTHAAISGTVYDYPADGSFTVKNCDINGAETRYRIKVYSKNSAGLVPGDAVSFKADKIYLSSDTDGIYFYHTISDRCWLSATVYSEITVTGHKSSPLNTLLSLRKHTADKIYLSFSDSTFPVINALITGDKSSIPEKTKLDFSLSGVSHIFAVSGMHLSIWTGLIFLILRKRAVSKPAVGIFLIIFIILFCFFTGLSPSVLRAGIMQISLYLGAIFRKRAEPVNSLGLAASILLLTNPFLAGNVSFLLSASATFAITAIFPAIYEEIQQKSRLKRLTAKKIAAPVLLSVTVIAFSLPIISFFFGFFSFLSPVASLLCTPVAELLMAYSAAVLFIPKSFFFFPALCRVADVICSVLLKIISFFASLDFALCRINNISVAVWAVLTWGIAALLFFRHRSSASIRLSVLSSVAVLITASAISSFVNAERTVLYIPSSGNNFCMALSDNNGANSVIIGAGNSYYAASDVKEFLLSQTCAVPDMIAVPKNSQDNEKGLSALLGYFTPDTLVLYSDLSEDIPADTETVYADRISCRLWKNAFLEYETTARYSAGILTVNGTKTVMCMKPTSDFANADEKYLSGDLLISRGQIPDGINTDNYKTIIILSDHGADTLGLPDGILSTADGEITLNIKKGGVINADN